MRQEKIMKIIINHFLDPRIQIVPNSGSDRSWVWVAFDFSSGELEETVRHCSGSLVMLISALILFATIQKKMQTFAIRFNTSDIANEFKAAFLKGQEEMRGLLAGKDAGESEASKEVDDAASVLESLSVGKAEATSDEAAPASTDA